MKLNPLIIKKAILMLALTTALFSCVRDIDDLKFTELKPGVLMPVGTFTIGANNLTKLGDSIQVREGESGVIEFYYTTEVLQAFLHDRFTIGDQNFADQIPFNSFVFMGGELNEIKISEYNSFTISNSDLPTPAPDIKKIIFKSGFINLSQSKDFDHGVETTISFPKLTKNGVPLSITLANNATRNEPLAGYELVLTGVSGLESNTINYELSTTVKNTGVSNTGSLTFGFQFTSMQFNLLEGDFKTYSFDGAEGEFNLGLPETTVPDNIGFTNPRVELMMNNSSGIDIELTILELSVTTYNGDKQQVTGTYDDQPILIGRAAAPGENKVSEFLISNQNTDNIVELINAIPQSVFFKGETEANPNGTPASGNFVTDTSEVIVNAELVLPLEGFANNYAFIDTLKDVKLQIGESELINLYDVDVRLQVENSFPFDARLQLYFLDSTKQENIIDSLFTNLEDQKLFSSATIDATGSVESPFISTVDIEVANELYEKIKYAKNIKLVVYLFTPGADAQPQKNIKISADNYITIGMGISANAIIDLNKTNSN